MSESRIFTIKELKQVPLGTNFIHSMLGRCIVMKDRRAGRKMVFKKDYEDAHFVLDEYPWDEPMVRIESSD